MKTILTAASMLGLIALVGTPSAFAQSASAEEIKICQETIKEMTGGKPPAEAVKLCNDGKLNEAIERAMAGG